MPLERQFMFIEPAAGSTSTFPACLSRVTLVWGSAMPFQSGLHNLCLRRPRTLLVVVKHNAMKNPETYFAENQSFCVSNCVEKHENLTTLITFESSTTLRKSLPSLTKSDNWPTTCFLGRRLELTRNPGEYHENSFLHLYSCSFVLYLYFFYLSSSSFFASIGNYRVPIASGKIFAVVSKLWNYCPLTWLGNN